MNSTLLIRNQIVFFFSLIISLGVCAQHTIYPDLFLIGSDTLISGVQGDTFFVFDVSKGGFYGGVRDQGLGSWNRESIGGYSFSFGRNNIASGLASVSTGRNTEARSSYSTSMGWGTKATKIAATAFGRDTEATGSQSLSLGWGTIASGETSFASGVGTEAIGGASTAMGLGSKSIGISSFAIGSNSSAKGAYSMALGFNLITNANVGLTIGQNNDSLVVQGYNASDKPLLIIGNGSFESRSNAMVVRQTGKIGIGEDDPEGYIHIKQPNTLADPQLKITGDGGDGFIRIELNREGIEKSWFHSVTTNATDASSFYSIAYETSPGSFLFPIRMDGNGHTAFGKLPGTNRIEVSGDASKTTAGDWLANSDRRIKTDIKELANSFELLQQLRPVKFKYTNEWKERNSSIKDHYYYNFIAQEYQEVFPESVQGSGEYLKSDENEILQIDTYNAQIVTIAAVKELIKEMEELREENERLKRSFESRYNSLEAKINRAVSHSKTSVSEE